MEYEDSEMSINDIKKKRKQKPLSDDQKKVLTDRITRAREMKNKYKEERMKKINVKGLLDSAIQPMHDIDELDEDELMKPKQKKQNDYQPPQSEKLLSQLVDLMSDVKKKQDKLYERKKAKDSLKSQKETPIVINNVQPEKPKSMNQNMNDLFRQKMLGIKI